MKKKEKIKSQEPEEIMEIAKEVPLVKEIMGEIPEEEKKKDVAEIERVKIPEAGWVPKTKLGREVKAGKIKNIDEIFDRGLPILEAGIADALLSLQMELINIGQSKGKFGGGKRRVWRQTQKKTAEGNVPSFACMVVVGDGNGHIGLGLGKARETLPAKEKAIRKAKLNLIQVRRGCGSFDCICREKHSIPFKVEGKSGSAKITLIPAPKGTGLAIEEECKKVMRLAGISDIYSKTFGQTRTKFNLIGACFKALEKLKDMKRSK